MLGHSAAMWMALLMVGQADTGATAPPVPPHVVQDYFIGDWTCAKVGGGYTGRMKSEWTMNNTTLVAHHEFTGGNGVGSLLVIRRWDPVDKRLRETQYASWNTFREASYEVVPQGDFFKLVGVGTETTGSVKRESDIVIEVHDANHFTWNVVPRTNNPAPFSEDYTRVGSAPLKHEVQEEPKDEAALLRDKLAEAAALWNQQKFGAAVKVVEETMAKQTELLGEDHEDVQQSRSTLAGICRSWALSQIRTPGTGMRQCRLALTLAQRAKELTPDDPRDFLIASAQERLGDLEGASKSITASLQDPQQTWAGQMFVAALIAERSGDHPQALDWFGTACTWMQNHAPDLADNQGLRSEAAAVLNIPTAFQANSAQRVEMLSRLIEKHPKCAALYHMRGSQHGRLSQWEKAADNYAQAADLNPALARHREAEATVRLYAGPPEQALAACQKYFDQYVDHANLNVRDDVVVVCSLAPKLPVDRKRLVDVAQAALEENPDRTFLQMCKGLALYRAGQYEQALEALPPMDAFEDNPKDAILPDLFRAMAHAKLGDAFTSRKLLDEARETINQLIAEPDGAEAPYQDRPVVWCMVQCALREAESMIK